MNGLDEGRELRRIRVCLAVFITGLLLSGFTAFPLVHESALLVRIVSHFAADTTLFVWLQRVHDGLAATSASYPFLAYGTDWLAFAHLVLAALYVGAWRDPVRNKWVLQFALIACAGVLPLALIAGPVRGIPWWWRLGDCSFGMFGAIPVVIALRSVRRLEGGGRAGV